MKHTRLADGLRLRDTLRVCDTPRKNWVPRSRFRGIKHCNLFHFHSMKKKIIILFFKKYAIENNSASIP